MAELNVAYAEAKRELGNGASVRDAPQRYMLPLHRPGRAAVCLNTTCADSVSSVAGHIELGNRAGVALCSPRLSLQPTTRFTLSRRIWPEAWPRFYHETDPAQCDREATLQDLQTGQYYDPMHVIAFQHTRGIASSDVSYEFAAELQRGGKDRRAPDRGQRLWAGSEASRSPERCAKRTVREELRQLAQEIRKLDRDPFGAERSRKSTVRPRQLSHFLR